MAQNKYGNSNESNVIELIGSNFDVQNNKIVVNHPLTVNKYGIIKFYAPWCPHCTDMVDDLEFLAKNLPKMDKPFFVSAVNCTNKSANNHIIAEKCGVKGFPTLYFVNEKGELEEFNPTSRSVEGLLHEICVCTKRYNSNICCNLKNNKLDCN